MNEPSVCAIMLTRDRPDMAKRAGECFRAQTYDPARRQLLIYDTGNTDWFFDNSDSENELIVPAFADAGKTIGALRNAANGCTIRGSILLHWDSDDYSHPTRIAEQVALLQSSGAEAVGYNEMLFWRDSTARGNTINGTGEAWLYRGDILGTSLCYWHGAWQRKPFPNTSYGEDTEWLCHIRAIGAFENDNPRMIARIHAGNAKNPAYDLGQMKAHPAHWTRVPEWDKYCAERMEL